MITIGVDPGLMTGVAILPTGFDVPIVREIHGRENVYRWFYDEIVPQSNHNSLEIVIEDFEITMRTGTLSRQYDALYIIGALEALCARYGVRFYKQHRSAKTFGSNEKLKHLGWYKPSKGGHQNDAQRHLLRHLVVLQRDERIITKLKEML